MSPAPPFAVSGTAVRLAVRLTPRSSSDRILGIEEDAAGESALKVAVTAAPEDGRANEALLRLLAKKLRLPRRDFEIFRGAASRQKLVSITGEPRITCQKIEEGLRPWLIPN